MRRWSTWIGLLLVTPWMAFAADPAQAAEPLEKPDRILVLKSRRELRLLRNDVVLKIYPIALGQHPKGSKRRQGDGRTPEGTYVIDGRLTRTLYHLALHISYPNEEDLTRARIAGYRPGGISSSTACPRVSGTRTPSASSAIGRMAASPSATLRSRRYGTWSTMGRRSSEIRP
jgi:hypothetical protein